MGRSIRYHEHHFSPRVYSFLIEPKVEVTPTGNPTSHVGLFDLPYLARPATTDYIFAISAHTNLLQVITFQTQEAQFVTKGQITSTTHPEELSILLEIQTPAFLHDGDNFHDYPQ